MSLRKVHIDLITKLLVREFSLARDPEVSEEVVAAKIQFLISQNMEDERTIENEARGLLEKNRRSIGGDLDEQKAIQMIKKQIAKQKGFTL